MTSNLGADRIQAHARRDESFEELKDDLMELLRQSFRPELLNRIDEIIVFRALDREQPKQITRLLLAKVERRMHAQGVELEVSDEAVEFLANAGFDPQYGARPLRRAIQRLLEDELSERPWPATSTWAGCARRTARRAAARGRVRSPSDQPCRSCRNRDVGQGGALVGEETVTLARTQVPLDKDELVLGLLAAPGLSTEIAEELAADLPPLLAERVTDAVSWRVPVLTEPEATHLTSGVDAIDLGRERMLRHGWDLAVCVTDAPLRIGRRLIVADASATHGVALIPLPALGAMQTRRRASRRG